MRTWRVRGLFSASVAVAVVASVAITSGGTAGAAAGQWFKPSGGTPVLTNAGCGANRDTATPASDTVGQPGDCAQAGYVFSGRVFRYAQAMVRVPDYTGNVAEYPAIYVALDNPGSTSFGYARVGIEPCDVFLGPRRPARRMSAAPAFFPDGTSCPAGDATGWVAFAQVNNGASLGAADTQTWPIPTSQAGSGLLVSVYANPSGSSDLFTVTFPNGTVDNVTLPVPGAFYTRAEALADWGPAEIRTGENVLICGHVVLTGPMRMAPPVPPTPCRQTQFLAGGLTTAGGVQGTFRGPWTITPVEASSNGAAAPGGTLLSAPSYLWNDGNGSHHLGSDAFGVWVYQQQPLVCGGPREAGGPGRVVFCCGGPRQSGGSGRPGQVRFCCDGPALGHRGKGTRFC